MIETIIEILGIGRVLGIMWITICLAGIAWAIVQYISEKFKNPRL
jgi:hypothetical protein